MRVLVPLVAALVPLLITPGLLSYFDVTPKLAILLFGTALILLYFRENWRNVRALVSVPLGRYFTVLLAAAWLACALATTFSAYRVFSLHGSTWRRFGFLTTTALLLFSLLAAAWLCADRKNVLTLLRCSTISGGIGAIYGIAQYFGWDPLIPAQAYQIGEGSFTIVRPPGTLGHADYFAAWLVIVTAFAVALHGMETERARKIAALVVAFLSAVAIVLSGTRSAILGLIAGFITFVILVRPRISVHAAAIALLLAITSVVFYYSPFGAKLRARVLWSLDDARGGARLLLWRDSLRMTARHPLSGFGPETFPMEFPRYESIELARAYPDFYHESPHNIFLDAFTSEGVLGLIALVGLCVLALSIAKRTAAALAAGFIAALVTQQFIVFIPATALLFYLLIAVMLSVWGQGFRPAAGLLPGRSWPQWLLLPLSVATSLVLAIFTVHLVATDRYLYQTNREIAQGNAIGASEQYKWVIAWNTKGAGSDLDYSRAMAQLANQTTVFNQRLQARQQAMEAAIRATSTASDRQNAWYNLALRFAAENDTASVERSLRNAIAWAPNWFKPHWTLAQLLDLTGRHQEALTEAAAAVAADGGRDPEVLETLHKLQP